MTEPSVICAWCKALLSAGSEPASHGVCPGCLQQHLGLAQEMVEAAECTRRERPTELPGGPEATRRSA